MAIMRVSVLPHVSLFTPERCLRAANVAAQSNPQGERGSEETLNDLPLSGL